MGYRFLISHHRGQERMLIRAQVWAPEWVSRMSGREPDDDEQPVPRDWFTADQWTVTDAPDQLSEDALRDTCAAHGWTLLGEATSIDGGTVVVPVEPADWEQVLHATAHHRNLMRQAWEAAETAWMGIVAGVPARRVTTATSAPSRSPRSATSAASASTRSKTRSIAPRRSVEPWPPSGSAAKTPSQMIRST